MLQIIVRGECISATCSFSYQSNSVSGICDVCFIDILMRFLVHRVHRGKLIHRCRFLKIYTFNKGHALVRALTRAKYDYLLLMISAVREDRGIHSNQEYQIYSLTLY